MGQLVLGGVGAVIGAYFGGPMGAQIGFMIGSMIGGLLFPPKHHYPALQDLRMQNSAYGQPINWCYGIVRCTGNVIWCGPPHQHNSGGGKGASGPAQSNYTISFAVGICEGPIAGIRRIWANGKLIYDVSNPSDFKQITGSNSMTTNFVTYLGDENQLPDPTIASYVGAGLVPPFRGLAYVVFNELDLTPFGQSLPNLSFEVVQGNGMSYTFSGTQTIAGLNPPQFPEYTNTVTPYSTTFLAQGAGVKGWAYSQVGSVIHMTPYTIDSSGINREGVAVNVGIAFPLPGLDQSGRGGILSTTGAWFDPENGHTGFEDFPLNIGIIGSGWTNSFWCRSPDKNTLVYSWWTAFTQYGFVICQPGGLGYTYAPFVTNNQVGVAPAGFTGGYIYGLVQNPASGTGGNATYGDCLVRLDYSGNLVAVLGRVDNAQGLTAPVYVLDDNNIWVFTTTKVWYWNGSTFSVATTAYNKSANIPIAMWQSQMIASSQLSGSATYTMAVPTFDQVETTVSAIIDDVCTRAGLPSGMWDSSQAQDTVRGYVVNNAPSARDALTQLMQLFFTDVSDSAGTLKFVRRGAYPTVTIPYSDIGVANTTQDPASIDPLKRTLLQEYDLPQQLSLTTYSASNDYNTNTQTAFRTQTASNYHANVKAAVVMTDGENLQCAQTILWATWINAESFEFTTDLSYLYLEPTDVVTVVGKSGKQYTLKLTKVTNTGKGVLTWTATLEAPSIYPAAGAPPQVMPGLPAGFTPQRIGYSGATRMVIMDIPPLRVQDAPSPGVYIGMSGTDSTWPGATIELSRDSSTFSNTVTGTSRAAIGYSMSILGPFTGGGDQVDELSTVKVMLWDSSLGLQSVTYANFLNNENVAYLGGEIIGFRNAVLQGDGSYLLNGLIRGMFGTERFKGTHAIGEDFCFLDQNTIQRIGVNLTDFGQTLYFLARTGVSTANDSTVPKQLTLANGNIQPLPPAKLRAIQNFTGSSRTVAILWLRRARINAGWYDGTDVPLDETTEGYTVTVYNSANAVVFQYSFSQTWGSGQQPNITWPNTTAQVTAMGATGVGAGTLGAATYTVSVQQHSDQGVLGVASTATFSLT
jgi:hypothetical protein